MTVGENNGGPDKGFERPGFPSWLWLGVDDII